MIGQIVARAAQNFISDGFVIKICIVYKISPARKFGLRPGVTADRARIAQGETVPTGCRSGGTGPAALGHDGFAIGTSFAPAAPVSTVALNQNSEVS